MGLATYRGDLAKSSAPLRGPFSIAAQSKSAERR
jgi:hypothetical protein